MSCFFSWFELWSSNHGCKKVVVWDCWHPCRYRRSYCDHYAIAGSSACPGAGGAWNWSKIIYIYINNSNNNHKTGHGNNRKTLQGSDRRNGLLTIRPGLSLDMVGNFPGGGDGGGRGCRRRTIFWNDTQRKIRLRVFHLCSLGRCWEENNLNVLDVNWADWAALFAVVRQGARRGAAWKKVSMILIFLQMGVSGRQPGRDRSKPGWSTHRAAPLPTH